MPTPHAPSRRSVVRAAAWTAPAVSIAVAAPAYAACSPSTSTGTYEFSWQRDYTGPGVFLPAVLVNPGVGTVGTTPVTVRVSSQFFGDMEAGSAGDGASNLTVSPFNVGGTGAPGLTIMQRAKQGVGSFSTPRSTHRQEVTLTFSRPVTNLKFKFTDIDSLDEPSSGWWSPATRQYQDRIFVSGGASGLRGSQVTGTGTSATDSWRPTGANIQHNPTTGTNGNVDVTYPATPGLSTYKITYWNDQEGTLASRGLQGVFVGNLTFTAATCA